MGPEKNTDKVHVQTIPEADIDPDHNLLLVKICAVLKKNHEVPKRITKMRSREVALPYDGKGKMLWKRISVQ